MRQVNLIKMFFAKLINFFEIYQVNTWAKKLETQGFCKIRGIELTFGPTPPVNLLKALARGSYESKEAKLVHQFLEEEDVVLELGAGIGYMGLLSKNKCPSIRYIAYEANPKLIPIIKENIKRNNAEFEIRNRLLLDNQDQCSFFIRRAFWASSLSKPKGGYYEEVKVECENRNEVMAEISPSMLIIDIEGGEVEFLDGLDLRTVKKIILEIHPLVLSDQQISKIFKYLLDQGFVLEVFASTKKVLYWYKP